MIEKSRLAIFSVISHFCMNKTSTHLVGDSNRQVFNKLISVPSWAAAWEANKELHKKVQTLHEDTSTCAFHSWSLTFVRFILASGIFKNVACLGANHALEKVETEAKQN